MNLNFSDFEDSQHKLRQWRCASLQAKGCSYPVCMCLISRM